MEKPRTPKELRSRLTDTNSKEAGEVRKLINAQLDRSKTLMPTISISEIMPTATVDAVLDEFRTVGWNISDPEIVQHDGDGPFPGYRAREYVFTPRQ